MVQSTRNTFRYYVLKTTLQAGLGLPETPIEWLWEGRGLAGLIVSRRPDVVTANVPVPGMTRVEQRWILTPFDDIRSAYFPNINPHLFQNLTISFDTTRAYFDLNREE